MRDLDWSDVLADAEEAFQVHLDEWCVEWSAYAEVDLKEERYWRGADVRTTGIGVTELMLLNHIVRVREECMAEFGDHDDHGDCERILDTMSGAYDPSWDYDYDEQTAHYERFGRPALPNEY